MKYHISFDLDFKRNTEKGLYIVLEGIDGSGKTTQAELLVSNLKKQGREVVRTREPRKDVGLIGKLIQEILHGKANISPVAFQYLFSADRQMHHQELILPALKAGKIVVSDRNFWSAIPYGVLDNNQTITKQAMYQKLVAQSILSFYHEFTVPDTTFFLDVSLAKAMSRINKVGASEIYEDRAKLKHAIEGYQWLLHEFPKEFTIIDANKSVEKVAAEMLSKITFKK